MHVLYESMFLISSNCSAIYLSIENKLISFRELKKKGWVSIRTSLWTDHMEIIACKPKKYHMYLHNVLFRPLMAVVCLRKVRIIIR